MGKVMNSVGRLDSIFIFIFILSRWVKTGDEVLIDKAGEVRVLDRLKV